MTGIASRKRFGSSERRQADYEALVRDTEQLFASARGGGNHEAERAIRPGVVNRKSRGGNLTRHGARTRQVLLSLLRTASQQARDPVEVIVSLLVSENPGVADLAIPVPRPQRPALPAARSP